MGLITIQEANLSEVQLQIPNEVIRELYFRYFLDQIQLCNKLQLNVPDIRSKILEFAKYNNPHPFLELVQDTLEKLSNRDWPGFDEKHLKAILIAYFYSVGIYHIKSEPEIEQKYPDILLCSRPPYEPPFQFMIELKFLHKKHANDIKEVTALGRQQLQGYLQAEEVQNLKNLRAWLFVFVATEAVVVEEIGP